MTPFAKNKSTEERISGALNCSAASSNAAFIYGFRLFRWTASSERSQQHCADEHERRESRQKIQVQGTVHEWPPSWLPMNIR
jgi:hypothetical protein